MNGSYCVYTSKKKCEFSFLYFIGFSFGGMLACYAAANLWKKSFISGDVLEKNVICITFGQPLIPIPYVEEAIKDFPQFEATIHAVYDKDDFFPRVLYYYAVGCSHYYEAVKTLSQAVDQQQAASLLSTDAMVNLTQVSQTKYCIAEVFAGQMFCPAYPYINFRPLVKVTIGSVRSLTPLNV